MNSTNTDLVAPEVREMTGPAALPRSNGELVFAAPWEGRVFGMAIELIDRLGLEWDEFRQQLIEAIDASPDRPYFESWTVALESLAVDHGAVPREYLSTPDRTP